MRSRWASLRLFRSWRPVLAGLVLLLVIGCTGGGEPGSGGSSQDSGNGDESDDGGTGWPPPFLDGDGDENADDDSGDDDNGEQPPNGEDPAPNGDNGEQPPNGEDPAPNGDNGEQPPNGEDPAPNGDNGEQPPNGEDPAPNGDNGEQPPNGEDPAPNGSDGNGDPRASVQLSAGHEWVTVAWKEVEEATGYYIYHAKDEEIDPASYAAWPDGTMVDPDATPHTVTGLVNGTTYWFLVTAVVEDEERPIGDERSATPGVLNDTGITALSEDDDGNPLPGQDAHFGRDAAAVAGTLYKEGNGDAGFDFTRLCNTGEAEGEGDCPSGLTASDIGDGPDQWACTRDNHTGLTWEVKRNDPSHLRHKGHTYTWYNSDDDVNGGEEGVAEGGRCQGDAGCDTEKFVNDVNTGGLCGAEVWRMPMPGELLSIVHNGVGSGARIDPDYFPNASLARFWSSLPHVDDDYAWAVEFVNGGASGYRKSDEDGDAGHHHFRVRLVHDGTNTPAGTDNAEVFCDNDENDAVPATTPAGDFEIHDDGTATHKRTGLTWMRCSLGQDWREGACESQASTHSWSGALTAVAELNGNGGAAGHADWRLPSKNELESIVERRCGSPAANERIFPDMPDTTPYGYWTSSPGVGRAGQAWAVDFEHGDLAEKIKENRKRVRLVR